ncbi:hypothetical protein SAMN04488523_1031, partial [Sulfitobacter brevis]
FLFVVLSVTKVTRSRPNSEADTTSSLNTKCASLVARYEEVDPSNEPNRPHISSDIKFSKSVETKETKMRRNFQRAPPRIPLILFSTFRTKPPLRSFRLTRPAPRVCMFASPVKAYLRLVAQTRNPFLPEIQFFCGTNLSLFNINNLLRRLRPLGAEHIAPDRGSRERLVPLSPRCCGRKCPTPNLGSF